MNFEWYMPTRVIFADGSLARLPEAVRELGAKRVVVVVGEGAMDRSGVLDRVHKLLDDCEVGVHSGVRANLPIQDCDGIIRSVRDHAAEVVVGLGGGSVMDGAKAAAWMAPEKEWTSDYLAGKRSGPGIPFVAIPTTSGTGSEVTPFIILLDQKKKQKLSLAHPAAMAKVAIVDPELTRSLPPDQTAATGLDALSHGFESYWSKRSNPISDALALEAISLVLEHLETAYQSPEDPEARAGMSYGAMCAGLALSQTATAALHGLTYPMTAHYAVPHGIACAFLMREVLAINFHHLERKKQVRLLHHMKSNTVGAAVDLLTDLYQALNVPRTLADLKIPEREIKRFAEETSPANLERNIAPLSSKKIIEIWNTKR